MIDSVLKGTGNSRFLKSAVPAGTSWADALAMLQAGTFPIDFNGINTEGFQQVGTPLNKANLLKDATAAQIGLPPSTTPDGMFQALGNTGELHVWRKTVTTAQEIPAGYTLGDVVTGSFFLGVVNSGTRKRIYTYATSPKVGDDGTVYIDSTNTITLGKYGDSFSTIANTLPGKFVIGTATDGLDMTEPFTVVFYIPSDAQITDPNNTGYAYVDKYQPVTGYAKVPAGTTTTYPVSTNPNAYQEGDDAKPAGYTLGDVVTGEFRMSNQAATVVSVYVGSALTVNADGVVSIASPSSYGMSNNSSGLSQAKLMKGKYIQYQTSDGDFNAGDVWFIPSDATIDWMNTCVSTNKRQPVTGYAAIPAGTTIEYLGKLGDKAQVQVVSYVGTGTYGESNPNSLTFDFVAKFIMELGSSSDKEGIYFSSEGGVATIPNFLDNDYRSRCGFGDLAYSWCKKSVDGKTITWYSTRDQYKQHNSSGVTYYYVAIG
nr:MAG TPA: hypothetical protein [Bacteriophage sp.]